ncbi:hypothetical protein [Deinococcus phoenicis]|uniref:hypothetical protein n=1 Tax=Deinococcus phoenicis TaxID=1476583 RepID=UPI001268DCBF|nr:hypothetical protein [Deinococcus phoenicis]
MPNLFTRAAQILERLPIHSSTKDLKFIIREDRFYKIDRKDALKTPENRNKLLSAIKECGYKGKVMPRFPQIVNRAKQVYETTGWKYIEEFMDCQRLDGGTFASVLLELGTHPLNSKRTQQLAKAAVDKLCGSFPAYWKIERMDSVESSIHVHILILIPEGYLFPKRVNNFSVKWELLGMRPQYHHKSTYENVRDFFVYLLKPSDARYKGRYFREMYFEWWENELNKESGEGATWENVALRGAKNLDISWLKGMNRAEIEGRYLDVPYKLHYAPPISPPNPLPDDENPLNTETPPDPNPPATVSPKKTVVITSKGIHTRSIANGYSGFKGLLGPLASVSWETRRKKGLLFIALKKKLISTQYQTIRDRESIEKQRLARQKQ